MMLTRRLGATIEVSLILALFLILKTLLKSSGFSGWHEPLFGAPLLSSCLLFFVLPLVFVAISGRGPGTCGLTTSDLRYHLRVALRALAFVAPATILFPVIAMLKTTHLEWLGASILTFGFVATGLLFTSLSRGLPNRTEAELSWTGLAGYLAVLGACLLGSYLLYPFSPLATKLIAVLIFVGFLEEFFFRGYVQSRLNDCFGKPFRFQNVGFGAGLVLTATVFGLFHPLTVADANPWPWALWTAAFGLVLGFLREKTGAVVTPAIVHGVMLIPGVLFGPI